MVAVTIPGGAPVEITFPTGASQALAQTIATAISNLGTSAVTLLGAGGSYTPPGGVGGIVINAEAPVTVTGSGSETVMAAAGGLTYIGAAATTDYVVVAGGNNTIGFATGATYNVAVGGTGNNLITDAGSGTINAGTGTTTIQAATAALSSVYALSAGTNDVIELGAGAATVGESGSHAVMFGGSGAEVVGDTGTNDTMFGGSGPLTVFGGNSGVYFASTTSTLLVGGTGVTGSDTLVGQTGATETVFGGTADVIYANSSSLLFVGGTGNASILGGAGDDTIFGNNDSNINYSGSFGTPILVADAGLETLSAATATAGVVVVATNGNSSIIGGAGPDTAFAGTGNTTLTGGGGSNVYAFVNGESGGTETITDFKSTDTVILIGYGGNEVAQAMSTAVTTGAGTTITLADNTKVTFLGISSLSSSRILGF